MWNKTPQEIWNGRKPGFSDLSVFCRIVYVHVPDERRSKLDDKSEKLVLIGYDMNSKGYKQYNSSNEKTIISRDVEFDEEGAWGFGFPDFEEEEQVIVEQPREEPTIPIATSTPADNENSPPSFLKEKIIRAYKESP